MRQRTCRDAEPLIGSTFRLAELVANHQPIHLCHLVGDGDLHRIGSIPLVGWDSPSRGVRLGDEAELLKFGENSSHCGGRDAESIAVGNGGGADREGGTNVLLHQGAEDQAGAVVEESRPSLPSHSSTPFMLALRTLRVPRSVYGLWPLLVKVVNSRHAQ